VVRLFLDIVVIEIIYLNMQEEKEAAAIMFRKIATAYEV